MMRRLRPAGVATALFVLTACGSGEPQQRRYPPLPPHRPQPPHLPPAPTMSDLEVIEAGVAAFYSGEAERAAELFELADRTDDQIRAESAYQAAIGGDWP